MRGEEASWDIMNAFIRTLRLLSDKNVQGLARAFNFFSSLTINRLHMIFEILIHGQ